MKCLLHGALSSALIMLLGAPAFVAAMQYPPAIGQGPAPSSARTSEQRLAEWDRNEDNALSLDEYSAEARAAFDTMDTDRNGNISVVEMDAAQPQAEGELSSAQRIALLDGNEDGTLSLDEYQDDVEARFDRIDVNDDDVAGVDELKSGWPVPVPAP